MAWPYAGLRALDGCRLPDGMCFVQPDRLTAPCELVGIMDVPEAAVLGLVV